jgi:hypothetical protein
MIDEGIMKKTLSWLIVVLFFCGFWGFTQILPVRGEANPLPVIKVVISLQQDKIRINGQIPIRIIVNNESDVAVDSADLSIVAPDFFLFHQENCAGSKTIRSIQMGNFPAHSTKSQTICLSLDRPTAQSGAYKILFVTRYDWEQNSASLSEEKTIEVDLIGAESILGIPIAFAGFFLPGLMLLITLKGFGIPWAVDLKTEDRIFYSIFISLIIIGPISLLATNPTAPLWIQWLSFDQQVNLVRLAVYILLGLGFGLIIGFIHRWVTAREKANATLDKADAIPEIIRKSLILNPDYRGGPVTLTIKSKTAKAIGSHTCETDGKYYIFPEFSLTLDQISPKSRRAVEDEISSRAPKALLYEEDPKAIQKILRIVKNEPLSSFGIYQAVVEKDTGSGALKERKGEFYCDYPKDQVEDQSGLPNHVTFLLRVI